MQMCFSYMSVCSDGHVSQECSSVSWVCFLFFGCFFFPYVYLMVQLSLTIKCLKTPFLMDVSHGDIVLSSAVVWSCTLELVHF